MMSGKRRLIVKIRDIKRGVVLVAGGRAAMEKKNELRLSDFIVFWRDDGS